MLDNLQKLTSFILKTFYVTRKATTHPASNMLDSYQATDDTEVDLGWVLVVTCSGLFFWWRQEINSTGFSCWLKKVYFEMFFCSRLCSFLHDFEWILDVFYFLYLSIARRGARFTELGVSKISKHNRERYGATLWGFDEHILVRPPKTLPWQWKSTIYHE